MKENGKETKKTAKQSRYDMFFKQSNLVSWDEIKLSSKNVLQWTTTTNVTTPNGNGNKRALDTIIRREIKVFQSISSLVIG